jgi:hypothetical protein
MSGLIPSRKDHFTQVWDSLGFVAVIPMKEVNKDWWIMVLTTCHSYAGYWIQHCFYVVQALTLNWLLHRGIAIQTQILLPNLTGYTSVPDISGIELCFVYFQFKPTFR